MKEVDSEIIDLHMISRMTLSVTPSEGGLALSLHATSARYSGKCVHNFAFLRLSVPEILLEK